MECVTTVSMMNVLPIHTRLIFVSVHLAVFVVFVFFCKLFHSPNDYRDVWWEIVCCYKA